MSNQESNKLKKLNYESFFFWKIPIGWKKLHKYYVAKDENVYDAMHIVKRHGIHLGTCGTKLCMAIDLYKNKRFIYCPKCMLVTEYID